MGVETSIFANAGSHIKQISKSRPLEVLYRGRETQRQVGENLKTTTWRVKG